MNTAQWKSHVACALCIGCSVLVTSGCGIQKPLAPCQRVVMRGVNPPDIALFLTEGEMLQIEDQIVCEALREYFPGLGTGRVSFMGVNAAENLRMEFHCTGREEPIVVHVRDFRFWNSSADKGYFHAKDGLKEYLHVLFFKPGIQEVPRNNRETGK